MIPQGAIQAAATEPGGNWTNYLWAQQLLENIGAPTSSNNVSNLMRWMSAEEPAANWWDRNNPLNASTGTSASDGTGSYPDLATGAQFTAKELTGSNYAAVVQALRSNADPASFSTAVVKSPWAASHYGVAAAGAPARYVVAGRGLDYLATLGVPGIIASGTAVTAGTGPTGLSGQGGGANAASSSPPTFFGIPATPPQVPSLSLDPITDLGRAITFGTQFLGWSIFTLAIFTTGAALMVAGGVCVGIVLIGPVAGPVASAVGGRSPVGRAVRTASRASRAGSRSTAAPARPHDRPSRAADRPPGETESGHRRRLASYPAPRMTPAQRARRANERRVRDLPPDYLADARRRREATLTRERARRAARR